MTKRTAASAALDISKRALKKRERANVDRSTNGAEPPALQSHDIVDNAAEQTVAAVDRFPARYKLVLTCMTAFVICNMVRFRHLEHSAPCVALGSLQCSLGWAS